MSDITYENKKSHSLRTGIIFILALTLTCVSLAMITEASWERSGTLMEAVIMSFLAGGVALSAHLLPALTKRRVGKFGWGIVSMIWVVAVLVTLYSHTVFFVSTMTAAGNSRAEKSSQVQDIKTLSDENKKLMTNTDARSVVAISRDIANVDIQINQLTPRACANCKRIKASIAGLQAKKDALNVEMTEAQRVASLRDNAIKMDEEAAKVKDNARLDPVTEKLVSIFHGMNVDGVTLFISVVNAALLEMLASLFWWLVWPDKKFTEGDVIKKPINNNKKGLKNNSNEAPTLKIESLNNNEEKLLLGKAEEKPLSIEKSEVPLIADKDKVIYNKSLIAKINEDIFIDPYVSNIYPIYRFNDKRKVNSNFTEEEINAVSFIREIIPQYKKADELKEKTLNVNDFSRSESESSLFPNFDSLFNQEYSNPKSEYEEDNATEIETVEQVKKDDVVESVSIPAEVEIEDVIVNEEAEIENEEEIAEEINLENEVLDLNQDNISESNEELNQLSFDQNETVEERKTANSDISYVRPRPKIRDITENVEPKNIPENDKKEVLKAVEEEKESFKIERIVPKFNNDSLESEIKKVSASFSKKNNEKEVPDEQVVFEVPVRVDPYEDNKSSIYINRRKNNNESVTGDDVLNDLFPGVIFDKE